MNEDATRKRLGRGLAALIGEADANEFPPTNSDDERIAVDYIMANPNNPRRDFRESELAGLENSIREHGIVQPVVVRPVSGSVNYEIIAGERRWRAAIRAGLSEIPAIVRDIDDRAALELAIVENVQRADLNPVEEAQGYRLLIDNHGYGQTELANVIGKSRSHVANTLRLLTLPETVRSMLTDGNLTAGHARALITANDPVGLAWEIVENGLSVRQAEAIVQDPEKNETTSVGPKQPSAGKDADTKALEKALGDVTGMVISIKSRGPGGKMTISYKSLDQLDDLCRRLRN